MNWFDFYEQQLNRKKIDNNRANEITFKSNTQIASRKGRYYFENLNFPALFYLKIIFDFKGNENL